jgi:hypothetical protein
VIEYTSTRGKEIYMQSSHITGMRSVLKVMKRLKARDDEEGDDGDAANARGERLLIN